MVTFTPQPNLVLDPKKKTLVNPNAKPKGPDIGIPNDDFEQQVLGLSADGVPLKQVHKAIDKHPGITDKKKAKSMAEGIYSIVNKSE